MDGGVGDLFDPFITSEILARDGGGGGVVERRLSTCILSSSRTGDAPDDPGDMVAIGGSAIPEPRGRGCGGRTVGNAGLGGRNVRLSSIDCRASGEAGACVRKGIGEGLVEGTGVVFAAGAVGEDTLRFEASALGLSSILDRFKSGGFSSELGLSCRFWFEEVDNAGDSLSLVEAFDPRCAGKTCLGDALPPTACAADPG